MDTCPFLGPLVPLFWTSGDVCSGYQSQSGQPYSHLAEVYMICSRRFISGATPFPVYMASIAAGHFPHLTEIQNVKPEMGIKIKC